MAKQVESYAYMRDDAVSKQSAAKGEQRGQSGKAGRDEALRADRISLVRLLDRQTLPRLRFPLSDILTGLKHDSLCFLLQNS